MKDEEVETDTNERPLLLDAEAVERRMLALAAERGAMLPALTPDGAKALIRDVAWCLVGARQPRPVGEVIRRITARARGE